MDQNKKTSPIPLIVIATISLAIPFGLYLFGSHKTSEIMTKSEHRTDEMMALMSNYNAQIKKEMDSTLQDIMEVTERIRKLDTVPTILAQEPEPVVQWLGSPVTQIFRWDSINYVWVPAGKDNTRYNASIQLGLKEDGTVIWRKAR